MRIVIVTGISGAGKSTALKMLEDAGYFCVDNLPVPLLPKFMEMLILPGSEYTKVGLGIGMSGAVRSSDSSGRPWKLWRREDASSLRILFLDASDEAPLDQAIQRDRDGATRLRGDGRVDKGIDEEALGRTIFLRKAAGRLHH
ncbi:MAG: RNase adapter RapZ [Sellimonas intestinalis]